MTAYGFDSDASAMVALWPAGVGNTAIRIAAVDCEEAEAMRLADALSYLSSALWSTYTGSADEGDTAKVERDAFEEVEAALRSPNLPSGGVIIQSYIRVLESAHTTGRVLHRIADPGLVEAVVADVRREIDAIKRAEHGDLSGRAVQAVELDRLDPSPVQVAYADRLLQEDPTGAEALLTTVDPAAACVATAHWLTAAANVAGHASGTRPGAVFAEADNIQACSIEVPGEVVDLVHDGMPPSLVVLSMLEQALAAAEGEIPNLDDVVAGDGGVTRTTPLDPRRPARDLLEHLLDGLGSCSVLFEEAFEYEGSAPVIDGVTLPHPPGGSWEDYDPEDESEVEADAIRAAITTEFERRVREEAVATAHRLTE